MVEGQDAGNEETARNRDALDVNKHVLLHQESKKLSLEMILIHIQFIKVGEHDREVGHKHLDQQYYSNAVDFHGDAEFSGNMTQVVANTQEAAQDYGIENAGANGLSLNPLDLIRKFLIVILYDFAIKQTK